MVGCKLSEDERISLEMDIMVEELDEAVAKCNSNSASGIDGIGNNFITVCNNRGTLTETFRTALIRLIPKKGDVSHIKNWRPISLLSCF